MEKHIDTMGFLLAAIVISITLLGDREARRSERQIDNTRQYQDRIRAALGGGQTITPASISEWVRHATAESDHVIVAARLLNAVLIGIVVVVGSDALRLLWMLDAEGPLDAPLLVIGLMSGAVVTGAYGEVHARMERSKAAGEFEASDLGLLARVSAALHPDDNVKRGVRRWRFQAGSLSRDRLAKLDTQVDQVQERFPDWVLVPELRSMEQLIEDRPTDAVDTLLLSNSSATEDFNLPILLTSAMARAGRLDEVLIHLDGIAAGRGTDRVLDELRFDLGLLYAHREQIFTSMKPFWADELVAGEPLAFDVPLGEVEETSRLRDFGRVWTDRDAGATWTPEAQLTGNNLPLYWLWQIVFGREQPSDIEAMRVWRDSATDAAALESLGFGCLAAGLGDDAVELFETAIRFNSSSGASHWGAALSYFHRSWQRKAMTSLKRARICGFTPTILDVTDTVFSGEPVPSYESIAHRFGRTPEFGEQVALSLLGVTAPLADDGTPRNRFAMAFSEAARRSVADGR